MSDHESDASSLDAPWLSLRLDTSVAHPARRYNYWLGGRDNFAADRASGDEVAAAFPSIRTAALENRAFLRRAVTFLAGETGVRQFLDVGVGLPAPGSTHEVVQRLAPESRVVYVDNDLLVVVHARARLTRESGVSDYVEADVRNPDKIVEEATRTLDFSQPTALMLVAILHYLADEDDPYGIVTRLVGALAPGSYLVISHTASDYMDEVQLANIAAGRYGPFWARSREQFARFFDGLELLPPGITSVAHWRADNEPQPRPTAAEAGMHCAVARIP
jgi:hypothetical protein